MKRIVAGILRRKDQILICQRSRRQVQGLKWEFPGGKIEPGEEERAALERELREELDVASVIGPLLARIRHRYSETGSWTSPFTKWRTSKENHGTASSKPSYGRRWIC